MLRQGLHGENHDCVAVAGKPAGKVRSPCLIQLQPALLPRTAIRSLFVERTANSSLRTLRYGSCFCNLCLGGGLAGFEVQA